MLYFANRASAMIFIVLTIIANAAALEQTGPMNDISCDRMVQTILVFAVIQTTLSSFVLAFRCMALYKLKWTVVLTLSLMMCLQFAFAIPVITTVPWTPGYPKGAAGCLNALTISDDSHLWCAINYLWTAIVDITVLLLSIYRLTSAGRLTPAGSGFGSLGQQTIDYWTRLNSARRELGRDGNKSMVHFLIDQGVGAVLLTLLFNLPVMILEFIHLNSQAVFIIYNIGVVANSIISCHIISMLNKKDIFHTTGLTMSIVSLNDHSRRREPTSGSGGIAKYTYSSSKSGSTQPRTQELPSTSSQIELTDRWEGLDPDRKV